MVVRPLLNIDLGELPDEPDELYALADLASIACGGHAGDEASMGQAIARARAHGVVLAAHPSYPDRDGFGRRSLALTPAELQHTVAAQCAALRQAGERAGLGAADTVSRVKAHGALYHDVRRDPALAAALLAGAAAGLGLAADRLVVLGPPGLAVGAARLLREGFADRGYGPDENLLPRGTPGALLTAEQAATQARRLAAAGDFDTRCVHGDSTGAVDTARAVRTALSA